MRDRVTFAMCGGALILLGAIFFWARGGRSTGDGRGEHDERDDADVVERDPEVPVEPIVGQDDASSEFAILTGDPRDQLDDALTLERVVALLDERHCGVACDVVRRYAGDARHVEIERTSASDYILPPSSTLGVVGASLTAEERASIPARPTVVVIRVHGKADREHAVARTAFATALALAESIHGLVYDESTRRIQNVATFARAVPRGPLTGAAFQPSQIVVQIYRQPDGSARALTLGMERFGAPDLSLRGAAWPHATALTHVANAAAAKVAAREGRVPLLLTAKDFRETDVEDSRSVSLGVSKAERTEGDPDNVLVELAPADGRSWDLTLTSLFDRSAVIASPAENAALERIADKTRRALPGILARTSRAGATLFLKGPFRDDDAGSIEWMWIEASTCDAQTCEGTLASQPARSSSLRAGDHVSLPRDAIADFQMKLPDGGVEGGESITTLSRGGEPR